MLPPYTISPDARPVSYTPLAVYKRQGEKLLESTMERRSGVVRIGASETALHGFLLKKLESFHNVYPGIKLKVQNSSTPGEIEDLKEERVDFAVVTTPCLLYTSRCV